MISVRASTSCWREAHKNGLPVKEGRRVFPKGFRSEAGLRGHFLRFEQSRCLRRDELSAAELHIVIIAVDHVIAGLARAIPMKKEN